MSATDKIPFSTPREAMDYLAREIGRMKYATGKRQAAARTQLRALATGIDSWVKLYRLNHDTHELQAISEEIDELRRKILGGPSGVVTGGKD